MQRNLYLDRNELTRLTLLFALFVLVAVTALLAVSWHASEDTREVDARRINQALATAIEREKQKVAGYLSDVDDWDDELLEDSRPVGNRDGRVRLIEANGDFDSMWLLDSSGREVLSFTPDQPNAGRFHSHPEHVRLLIGKLRGQPGPVVEVFGHHRQGSIFAMIRLEGESDFGPLLRGNGAGYILLQEDLDGDFLEDIKLSLQLERISLHPGDSGLGQFPIRTADGSVVASLEWAVPDRTGPLAERRIHFVIVMSILLAVIGFAGTRQLASSFRSLSRQARVDSLSRLPNRFELLRQMRHKRQVDEFAALALIDLDAFKSINDFHGHRVGDNVIRHVARLLRDCMPGDATVARLGGDEFAVFFARDGEIAEESLIRFLLRLSQPTEIEGCAFKLGASIGLAKLGASRLANEGLRQADIAMYAAKKRGKMQVVTYDEVMEAPLREMVAIKDELFRAIEAKQITVKYQPIISAQTGEIEALEALARWASPVRGNVAADLFIKVAEEFGLIGRLGELIIQQVIDDIPNLPNVRISLNVSTAQIASFEFTELLERYILSGKIKGELFDIEITETHLVHDPDIILQVMKRLSKLGVRFVLDDFGTGYASIGFLRQFPFHAVKIDRMIIEECLVSNQTRAVLASIVAMAHAFDMVVVAEGVETEKHAVLARTSGCDQMQGWHFGRAASPGDKSLSNTATIQVHAA